jgi:hypothetical protein
MSYAQPPTPDPLQVLPYVLACLALNVAAWLVIVLA